MTSHLGTQIMAALGCLVFFRLLLQLGISLGAASLSTVFLAFATLLPVYSRTAWSEALQATCFMGFYSALLRVKDSPGRKNGLWFGIWTGLLINSKYAFALVLPGAVLFLGYYAWRGKRLRPFLRAAGLGHAVGRVLLGGHPLVQLGSVGGQHEQRLSHGRWIGRDRVPRRHLCGPLVSTSFSFGKSMFLYSPPLVLSLVGATSRHASAVQPCLWAMVLTAGPIVCLYSKFAFWSGDWCWGPRYLLFLVPAFLVPAGFLLDDYLHVASEESPWLSVASSS
jgi:4-amino-4-deoxy-L-arabinose transferase-like glycosyltransferase